MDQYANRVLQRFVEQSQSMDEHVLTAILVRFWIHGFTTFVLTSSLKALNVVIRMEPIQKYPFNVRSFFTPNGKKAVGAGLELWRGYFQSIRPSVGRLIVNVDISTGMMYKAGTLIELCLDFLGRPGQEPHLLSPAKGFPDRERLRLQKFLKGLQVKIETKTSGPSKFAGIRGISREGADKIMFDHNGTNISVAQYFRQHLNQPLRYPSVICIEVLFRAYFSINVFLKILRLEKARCTHWNSALCLRVFPGVKCHPTSQERWSNFLP